MFPADVLDQAENVLAIARQNRLMISTAESCTGGLVGAALTALPGSSEVFDCSFTTYSYKAKTALLGVPQRMLLEHGAVSTEVATIMAEGALAHSSADVTVAVTGIAGPGGSTPGKPVGTVCFAAVRIGAQPIVQLESFGDLGRAKVRMRSVSTALTMLARILQ